MVPKKSYTQTSEKVQNIVKNTIQENKSSFNSNNELVIWENNVVDSKNEKKTTSLKKNSRQVNTDLLRQIESIEPDYEQRKLAIEVSSLFFT